MNSPEAEISALGLFTRKGAMSAVTIVVRTCHFHFRKIREIRVNQ